MELKWTAFALENLESYQRNSRKTPDNLRAYYEALIYSINLLLDNPYLGKVFYSIENYKIMQLIHGSHRIFYLIDSYTIVILSLVHTSYTLDNSLEFIKKYISEL